MRLIDADAMVQRLEERLKEVGKECAHLPGDSIEGLDILIDHLMLDSEIRTLREWINKQPTIEAEPKWIPCSEKLPAPRAESYWVCTDGAYQHECRWTNINPFWTDRTTEWHWNLFDTPPHSEVIAWMPLPEPYCGAKMEEQE